MVKKYKGGATTVKLEVDNSFGAWVMWILNLIKKTITTLVTIMVTFTVLLAGISVVFMFIGSYIMLGYFLQVINYIIKGLNFIIKQILGILKKFKVKVKGGKIKKVPTDPSQLVLKALGIKSFKDDETTETTTEENEECSDE
jgi:sensor histidine kinase YesM